MPPAGCERCREQQGGEPRLVSHTYNPDMWASVERCGVCDTLWVTDRDRGSRPVDLATGREYLPWLGEAADDGRIMSRYVFEHGGRTIVSRAEESLNPMIAPLFRLLGSVDPVRLGPGFGVDTGWAPLRLDERDGELVLLAPDLLGDPLSWTTDLSPVLRALHDQSTTCRLFGQPHRATVASTDVVLDRDVLTEPRVYLHRNAEPTDTDSGWFIGRRNRTDADNATLVAAAAGDLTRTRPALVRFLALPVGTLLLVDGDELVHGTDADDNRFFPPPG